MCKMYFNHIVFKLVTRNHDKHSARFIKQNKYLNVKNKQTKVFRAYY